MTHKPSRLIHIEARYTEQGKRIRMNRMNRDEHAACLEAYRAQGEAEYYKERAARQAQIHDTTEAFRRFVEQDGRKTRMTFV